MGNRGRFYASLLKPKGLVAIVLSFLAIAFTALSVWRDEGPSGQQPPQLIADVLDWLPWWTWIVAILGAAILVIAENAYQAVKTATDARKGAEDELVAQPRPFLEADDPFVRPVRMLLANALAVNTNIQIETGMTGTATHEGPSFVRPGSPWDTDSTRALDPPSEPQFDVAVARVRNDPPKHRDDRATAGKAITELTFFEIDEGKPRSDGPKLAGRWSDNEQPGHRDLTVSIADLRRRDLEPNGEPHLIDVALKYQGDDAMYAFNDESIRSSLDWREPKYTLAAEYYRVHLRVTGMNMTEPFECDLLLHNLGRGKSMEITRWQLGSDTEGSQPQPASLECP